MKVISCKILERNTDEKSPNLGYYESELIVVVKGKSYCVQKVTCPAMVEQGYISHNSQRAYMQYELVNEVVTEIRDELHNQINLLNIRERVKPL